MDLMACSCMLNFVLPIDVFLYRISFGPPEVFYAMPTWSNSWLLQVILEVPSSASYRNRQELWGLS